MSLASVIAADPRLGHVTDADLARAHGCSRQLVGIERTRLGIPRFVPPAPVPLAPVVRPVDLAMAVES